MHACTIMSMTMHLHHTGPNIIELLHYPTYRKKIDPLALEDIYDGYAHQSIDKTDGIQLSFIINTDGVEIFHTSNFHLWPVLLMINEFPPTLRFVYVLACNYNVYYIYFFYVLIQEEA